MWVFFAFLSVVFLNARNLATKFNVAKTHEFVSMWYTFLFQIPVGLIAILVTGIQIHDNKFYLLVLVRVVLDIIAFVFLFKALKLSQLSTVLPFMGLLPVFTLFTSFAINGQEIQLQRLLLVLIIASCCFLLFRNGQIVEGISNRRVGSYVMLVIFIYSVLDPLHAEIIKISTPFTYFFASSIYFIAIWSVVVFARYRTELQKSFSSRKIIATNAANGVILGLEVISLFLALVPGSVTAVVAAIRSTNIAISSVLGGLLFKESLSFKKVLLTGIITMAVVLLVL